MRTKIEAYMDGVPLSSVAPSIIVQRVEENTPKTTPVSVNVGTFGSRLTGMKRETMDIGVVFSVMGARDLELRAETIEQVSRWAQGTELTVNYRPGRRVRVACVGFPTVGNVKSWTDEYTVSFRAFAVPCWEADTMSTCRAIGRSVNPVLSVESLLDTVLEFEAVNNGNTYVEHLGIQANGGTMVFDELHLAPSERLTLTHKNGIQQVMIEGSGKRSALGKRLENSWDELPIKGGANTIIAVADVACNWVFRARGRFT